MVTEMLEAMMRYTRICRTTFLIFLMVTATALIIGSSLKSPIKDQDEGR